MCVIELANLHTFSDTLLQKTFVHLWNNSEPKQHCFIIYFFTHTSKWSFAKWVNCLTQTRTNISYIHPLYWPHEIYYVKQRNPEVSMSTFHIAFSSQTTLIIILLTITSCNLIWTMLAVDLIHVRSMHIFCLQHVNNCQYLQYWVFINGVDYYQLQPHDNFQLYTIVHYMYRSMYISHR